MLSVGLLLTEYSSGDQVENSVVGESYSTYGDESFTEGLGDTGWKETTWKI